MLFQNFASNGDAKFGRSSRAIVGAGFFYKKRPFPKLNFSSLRATAGARQSFRLTNVCKIASSSAAAGSSQ